MEKKDEHKLSFQEGKEEYTVKEFFRKFKDKLPVLAIVTQGYCGNSFFEEITKGEVIRIHTYSEQKRVIADIIKTDKDSQERKLSIPADFRLLFSPVKGNQKGVPLRRIIEEKKLPVNVTCTEDPGNDTVVVDGIHWRASDVNFRLLEAYDDIYLLGNTISENFLHQRVLAVPLYMSEIRIALIEDVKGFEGGIDEFMKRTASIVETNVVFNRQTGNDDIYFYDNWDAQKGNEYTYIVPKLFYNVSKKLKSTDRTPYEVTGEKCWDDIHIYDIISTNIAENLPNLKTALNQSVVKTSDARVSGNDYKTLPKRNRSVSDGESSNRSLSPNKSDETNEKQAEGERASAYSGSLMAKKSERPPLPPRRPLLAGKIPRSIHVKKESEGNPRKHHEERTCTYVFHTTENVKRDGAVNKETEDKDNGNRDCVPVNQSRSENANAQTQPPEPEMHNRELRTEETNYKTPDKANPKENIGYANLPVKNENTKNKLNDPAERSVSASDVSSMTMTEVCDWLCRLKLGQYTTVFVDNLIDGCILADLDLDVLTNELGLKRFEAIKLRKFVTNGYVPKV